MPKLINFLTALFTPQTPGLTIVANNIGGHQVVEIRLPEPGSQAPPQVAIRELSEHE